MNLESKELPKSFSVQVIWEWLTIRQQTMLSPHPHTSVTSLCAETMQSGWRVLSVISCWKIFIKCRAHGGNTGCGGAVSSAKFTIQGQRRLRLFLHPSFLFTSLLSCVMCANSWPKNKHRYPEGEQSCEELLHIVHMLNSEHWGGLHCCGVEVHPYNTSKTVCSNVNISFLNLRCQTR